MSKLDDMLQQMLDEAKARDKVPQKRKLGNGLHITLTAYRESVILAISRDTTFPSEQEWKTVCNHFPYYIGVPMPIKFTDNDHRMAMRAEVPSRQFVAQKLL